MTDNGKAQIEKLATVLNCRFSRDKCGDWTIVGRRGNIHADGTGYLIAVMLTSSRTWTNAKRRLVAHDIRVTQDGDWEGVVRLDKLPTPEQAAMLRNLLGIKKVKACSPETLERLRAMNQAYGFKKPAAATPQEGHLQP